MTSNEDRQRLERKQRGRDREEELQRVPLQEIDKSKWPNGVREISMKEAGGLGIDASGRLYWNGKPVEIVGRRLDLTWSQFFVALIVAVGTVVAALATSVQAWTSYHDWACKVDLPAVIQCPFYTRQPGMFDGWYERASKARGVERDRHRPLLERQHMSAVNAEMPQALRLAGKPSAPTQRASPSSTIDVTPSRLMASTTSR